MGILDTILGRSKLPKAKTDRLFAISTASITLETNLGIKPATVAGICFKPIESSRYETARTEIEDLLRYSCQETGTSYRLKKDEYNFLWAILEDPDFEDIVTNIHLVSQTM
ncbi:PspA-associated protein PspAB, partial [Methanomethylovorans sp.]